MTHNLNPFIHAVYTMEREWRSAQDKSDADLKNFDFIYLQGAPHWMVEDFDLSQEEIDDKYITKHKYSHFEGIKALIDAVHSQGNKILCSFSGTKFNKIAIDEKKVDKFANMMVNFIEKYNFDGIELDWEHTMTIDTHLNLIKCIRKKLNTKDPKQIKYYLTTALHSFRTYSVEQANELSDNVDWINLMYYDFGTGNWGTIPTHNSPLDKIIKSYNDHKWDRFDPKKLHFGMPNYGYYYKGIKPGEKVEDGRTLKDYGRYFYYKELPPLLKQGWKEEWDDKAKTQYYFSPDGNEFISIESERSLDEKYEWLKKKGFGGIFWWEYNHDWIKPTDDQSKGVHLLIDHIINKITKEK